jgi:hypothetical protein
LLLLLLLPQFFWTAQCTCPLHVPDRDKVTKHNISALADTISLGLYQHVFDAEDIRTLPVYPISSFGETSMGKSTQVLWQRRPSRLLLIFPGEPIK